MNEHLPTNDRDELEAQVTALLLGELTDEQAAPLRARMAQDRELAMWHDRLKQTLPLVGETVATPAGEIPAQPAPLKLSEERRQKLLAQFKTARPVEFAAPRRSWRAWMSALAAAAAIALLAAITIPSFVAGRATSQQNAIINNLRLLDSAKQQWALEQRKSATDVPKDSDLTPYLGRGSVSELPSSVAGETYVYGPVGQPPTAEFDHVPAFGGGSGWNLWHSKTANKASLSLDGDLAVLPARQAGPNTWGAAIDRDNRNLFALKDSESREMANASKSAAPASPAPQAQTPIILPPNDSDKDTNHYVLNAVGYVNVPIAGNEGIISAPPTASGGAGVGGFVQTDQRATFQSRAGGRFRRPAASADVSAEKKNGATAMASEPAQAAEGALASAAPISSRAKKSPVVTVDHLGTRSLDESLKVKQAASKDTATSDTATSPSVTVRGVALIDLDNGFIPQAQSAAGSTIGVPQIAVLSARSPANAKSPTTNAVIGDSPAIGALFGSAQEALKQPAQALAQNEYKKSTQEGQPTDINGILVLPDPALPNVNNFGVGVEGAVVLPSAAAGTTANGAIGVQGGTAPPSDAALPKGPVVALIPQPEVQTLSNAFSTFSLNVSDVAFKLAAASLENGVMPDISSMRSEEFVNAFDYRDPEPAPGAPIGFAWERAGDPFAHNRDFLRFSVKTAAEGRDAGRPLNLVLLLDKSGSMERADRVEIVRQALTVLAGQLQARDTLSVVIFARTAHLWVDGAPGNQAGDIAKNLSNITPEGGTDLEEAMKLAYATALRHYLGNGENRVVLLTDGAANLGEVDPDVFKPWVESNRKQGIALDCFGVGWDGYNDTTLESLSRAGGGRYGFINTPEDAATDFAGQLAGALRVAASDVKVQVEFNPNRVISYRQVGYAKHQLTKEQFRDNTVAAAQIGAAESGNALYTVEINPAGDGPVCTVRVRYHDPGTSDYREHAWEVPYTGTATPLDRATPAIRLAACAGAFSELLAGSPFAGEVTFDKLLVYLNGIPAVYGADTRPQKLEWMVRQAKSISGK